MSLADLLGAAGQALVPVMVDAGMQPLERAHFLAQCAHESAGFTGLTENLNYSAVGLQRIWPHRFTARASLEYAHKPEQIANRAYANKGGNGNEVSGDGWRFRGRGFIQLTLRENYAAASQRLYRDDRLVQLPEQVALPPVAALTALDYWQSRHLGIAAMHDDLAAVTRAINPALLGFDDRKAWLVRFKSQLRLA